LRQLLHLYKYGRVDEAGEILSDFLASKVGRHISALLDGDDDPVVLPVPMNRINMALRGFNQAEILAQSICRELELYALETGALSRCFSWKPQARLSGADKRSKNVAGVFRSDGSVQGVHVLLVDDVFTTGATISECARVLLGAGVEKLTVVTALKG
jgi:ComF family protein